MLKKINKRHNNKTDFVFINLFNKLVAFNKLVVFPKKVVIFLHK